jgi:hypothetical protein
VPKAKLPLQGFIVAGKSKQTAWEKEVDKQSKILLKKILDARNKSMAAVEKYHRQRKSRSRR